MKNIILFLWLIVLSFSGNLFAADGVLQNLSGTTSASANSSGGFYASNAISGGQFPAGTVATNSIGTNMVLASDGFGNRVWNGSPQITNLTALSTVTAQNFAGAGAGQGFINLSNAGGTASTVILGPSNVLANATYFSNTLNVTGESDLTGSTNYVTGTMRINGALYSRSNTVVSLTTNAPTDGYVWTATGTGGDGAWKPAAAGSGWTMQLLQGGFNGTMGGAGDRFSFPFSKVVSDPASTTNNWITIIPGYGYLSNFTVVCNTVFPATTNVTFCLQTNKVTTTVPACIDTPLKLVLVGDTGVGFTNTTTESVTLTGGKSQVGVMRVSNSAAISTTPYSWTIEWWHQ